MEHKTFIEALDRSAIEAAISAAEMRTSGELRVHVQPRATGGALREVAERTFERLGMTKTALRNGVLLFIASEENQFVILGDQGIDAKVPPGFWDAVATRLSERFRAAEFNAGIVEAIAAAGTHLQQFFPRADDDVDELPNEISIDA